MSNDIYDFLDGGDYDNDFDGESRNRFPPIYHVINDALNLDISNPGFKISDQEIGLRNAAIRLGTMDYYRYWPFRVRTVHRYGMSAANLTIPFEAVMAQIDEVWRNHAHYLGIMRINKPSWNQLSNPYNFDRYLLGVSVNGANNYDIMKTIAYETYEHLSTGAPQYEVDMMHSTIKVTVPFGVGQLIIDHAIGFNMPDLVEMTKVDWLCKFISYRFIESIINARSSVVLKADFDISTEALKERLNRLKEEVDDIKKKAISHIVKWD